MLKDHQYRSGWNFAFRVAAKCLLLALCFSVTAWSYAQQGKRTFGALTVDFTIDSVRNTALCRLSLDSQVMTTALVSIGSKSTFSINQGNSSSSGSLFIKPFGSLRELDGAFWFRSGNDVSSFSGALASWNAIPNSADEGAMLFVSLVPASSPTDTVTMPDFILAPLLFVRTKVWGASKNIAQVTILYGELPVFEDTVTQASPNVVTPDDIVVGDMLIKKGMSLKLAIPSSILNGNVQLNIQFITTDHPLTAFNAPVAFWPL